MRSRGKPVSFLLQPLQRGGGGCSFLSSLSSSSLLPPLTVLPAAPVLTLKPPARPAQCFSKHCRKGEINGVLGEGITQLNFDESRRKEEEGRTSRGGEGS
ncbi:unnamed protein product [Pleuronectes platessa]|uniref:Uncharacterized protein n=1 Tax=Pleuronectes platessa TaxID=8262 RepID=A0A9N7VK49_PLEPL|nr:unnamed protein product [Pleuronectes platessa]